MITLWLLWKTLTYDLIRFGASPLITRPCGYVITSLTTWWHECTLQQCKVGQKERRFLWKPYSRKCMVALSYHVTWERRTGLAGWLPLTSSECTRCSPGFQCVLSALMLLNLKSSTVHKTLSECSCFRAQPPRLQTYLVICLKPKAYNLSQFSGSSVS